MKLFAELIEYVGLDASDHARLTELGERLDPDLPAIAARFTANHLKFAKQGTLFDNTEQMQRHEVSLVSWMRSGLRGPYDATFEASRAQIGRRHVEAGLEQHYTFAAMNIIRGAYLDRVAAYYPAAAAIELARSVNKLLDLELAIMVRHYQLDRDEKLLAHERSAQAERLTALQTMTAGLAHEIRNPLNAAGLQLELLERRLQREHPDPRLLDPVDLASLELRRLTALLNDFLLFARPTELSIREHDVVGLLRHVCELEATTAATRGATLTLLAAGSLVTRLDGARISQVALNLVRNALDAVHPGGAITVELEGVTDGIMIAVTDDGDGMIPEVRARIFEPFFSTKEGGTGLGMSIVHSLVHLHGGQIRFETSPRGSRFEIMLPRQP